MAKLLNCCGEVDHLLFCNHYFTHLLKYSLLNTQYQHPIIYIQLSYTRSWGCEKIAPSFCKIITGKSLRLRSRQTIRLRSGCTRSTALRVKNNPVAERSRSADFLVGWLVNFCTLQLRTESGLAGYLRNSGKVMLYRPAFRFRSGKWLPKHLKKSTLISLHFSNCKTQRFYIIPIFRIWLFYNSWIFNVDWTT